jgi:hypothetical protein
MQKAADESAAFLGVSAISNGVDRLRQPYLAPNAKPQ